MDKPVKLNQKHFRNNEQEVWKAIEGFEDLYEVSSFGRVRSLDRQIWVQPAGKFGYYVTYRGKLLKPCIMTDSKGYKIAKVYLSVNSKQTSYCVANLVAQHFLTNPNNFAFVKHLDNNPYNNKASNLAWVKCINPCIIDRNKAGAKKVKCIETEEVYDSADAASQALGFSIKAGGHGIRHAAQPACKNKTYKGYHFEYIED